MKKPDPKPSTYRAPRTAFGVTYPGGDVTVVLLGFQVGERRALNLQWDTLSLAEARILRGELTKAIRAASRAIKLR